MKDKVGMMGTAEEKINKHVHVKVLSERHVTAVQVHAEPEALPTVVPIYYPTGILFKKGGGANKWL